MTRILQNYIAAMPQTTSSRNIYATHIALLLLLLPDVTTASVDGAGEPMICPDGERVGVREGVRDGDATAPSELLGVAVRVPVMVFVVVGQQSCTHNPQLSPGSQIPLPHHVSMEKSTFITQLADMHVNLKSTV